MDFSSHEWQVIANPNAQSAQRKILENNILNKFNERNIAYRLHIADGAGKGTEIAARLCREGERHIIAAGGDGTINEVVNGIYQSGTNPEEVYLAIIPLGTGNDFCRTLGYPKAEAFSQLLATGEFKRTDVGLVTSLNTDNQEIAKRYFINIAGFSFDAAVINETMNGKPKLFPSAVYLMKLVKVLFTHKATRVTVKSGNEEITDDIFTIAVGNAQFNGNGMRQVPMADPHDGMFDVVSIRKIRPMKVVKNVKKLFSGKHVTLSEVRVTHAKQVDIQASKPILGEVEGEMLAAGNYHISVEPRQLNVLHAN